MYRPLDGQRVGKSLPLDEYISSVADFSFRQNYGIVFDQLVAPTAAYIKGAELQSWFAESGLTDVQDLASSRQLRGAAAASTELTMKRSTRIRGAPRLGPPGGGAVEEDHHRAGFFAAWCVRHALGQRAGTFLCR